MTVELASHPKVKLRVDDFDLLALSGALSDLERTELLDGDIYSINSQYTRHGMVKAHFHESLLDWKRANRPELVVLCEVSVAMPPHDEPIPDVILCDKPTGSKGIGGRAGRRGGWYEFTLVNLDISLSVPAKRAPMR